jgi:predicted DCC family thiol-disulfide oxidoreductase YuxK
MKNPVSIFYDGKCKVCSLEMDHYKKLNRPEVFQFIDISSSNFKADSYGLDSNQVQKEMHVLDRNGQLKVGVDAFIAIWNELPRYRWLTGVVNQKWVRPFADLGYKCFATIRPILPKNKSMICDDGSCRI